MASSDPPWTGLKGVTSFLPGPLDELLGDASPGESRVLSTVGAASWGAPPAKRRGPALAAPPPHLTPPEGAGRGLGRDRTLPFLAQSTSLIPGSAFLLNFGTRLF